MNSSFPPAWHTRHDRPARTVTIRDAWCWRSAALGAVCGFVAGMLAIAVPAYLLAGMLP